MFTIKRCGGRGIAGAAAAPEARLIRESAYPFLGMGRTAVARYPEGWDGSRPCIAHETPTVPYRLRYQMAWNHGLSRGVLRVYTRVLLDVYRRGARERGIDSRQTGMVTAVQRAGGVLMFSRARSVGVGCG